MTISAISLHSLHRPTSVTFGQGDPDNQRQVSGTLDVDAPVYPTFRKPRTWGWWTTIVTLATIIGVGGVKQQARVNNFRDQANDHITKQINAENATLALAKKYSDRIADNHTTLHNVNFQAAMAGAPADAMNKLFSAVKDAVGKASGTQATTAEELADQFGKNEASDKRVRLDLKDVKAALKDVVWSDDDKEGSKKNNFTDELSSNSLPLSPNKLVNEVLFNFTSGGRKWGLGDMSFTQFQAACKNAYDKAKTDATQKTTAPTTETTVPPTPHGS